MAVNEVMRYFRRKSENGFDEPITYISAEQRFVTPLKNSGDNNLEEQFILGTDTYTETYVDSNGNLKIETSYHVNSDDHNNLTDYYKVVSTIYKDYMKKDVYFNSSDINLLNREKEVDPVDPTVFVTTRVDQLFYVTEENGVFVDTPILTKTTERKYTHNGAREVVRESITNHLAGGGE